MADKRVTAAVLLIGDELLSGRTRDVNLQTIANFLGPLGVQVAEARTVPDVQARIVEALNALRATYDYVFTTGGIGPTHDDITADAVAAAFGVAIGVHEEARAIIAERYKERGEALTEARLRMARTPAGASLIANPVSGAPGFQIENVFVLAGVPAIVSGMLLDVERRIEGGAVVVARTVRGAKLREGDVGEALGALQKDFPDVALGSYPFFISPREYGVNLVARGTDPARVEAAARRIAEIVRAAGVEPEEVA